MHLYKECLKGQGYISFCTYTDRGKKRARTCEVGIKVSGERWILYMLCTQLFKKMERSPFLYIIDGTCVKTPWGRNQFVSYSFSDHAVKRSLKNVLDLVPNVSLRFLELRQRPCVFEVFHVFANINAELQLLHVCPTHHVKELSWCASY